MDHPIVIHTSAPMMPLTQIVQEHGMIIAGQAAGGRADCIYGWGEAMASPATCKPHHLVTEIESFTRVHEVATVLIEMGYQVVVTDKADWSQVINSMPENYDNDHSH